jgi:hypothetical protein
MSMNAYDGTQNINIGIETKQNRWRFSPPTGVFLHLYQKARIYWADHTGGVFRHQLAFFSTYIKKRGFNGQTTQVAFFSTIKTDYVRLKATDD